MPDQDADECANFAPAIGGPSSAQSGDTSPEFKSLKP